MKIVIDTKEDIHILRHVIQLLHAVSTVSAAKQKYGYDEKPSSFVDTPSFPEPASAPPVADATPLFSMFDTPASSAPSTPDAQPSSFNSLFPSMNEEKKDDNKKDFLDSLEVY